jgi:Alginate lyase
VVSRLRSAGIRTGLLLLAVCTVAACSTSPKAPPAPAPPSGPPVPALAGWKLTLPTANDKGDAASVDPAQVTPPYLTTDPAGALVFWAPVEGATTKNSDHARTELNNLTNFPAGTARHELAASVTVDQVPTGTPDVIIAQIHGADDLSAVPFVMLHWRDGELRVVVKQERTGSAAKDYPLTSVALGTRFDVGIVDNGDGTMTFRASVDGDSPEATAPVPPAFRGATVRFQAGAYQQAESAGTAAAPDDGAKVTFSSLTAS